MGGGKKGGDDPKIPVTHYYASVHFGICHGPVDSINRLYFNGKIGWSGSVSGQTDVYMDQSNLFGGKKQEGGIRGPVHMMLGTKTQLAPSWYAGWFGRTPATMPAYRGIANAIFYGPFYWASNSNRLPDVWINVTRRPIGLDPATAMIGNDANPAHIIFEAMTNVDWGMGASYASFDIPVWNAAAQVLYNEGFGISMMWTDQMEIEKFITEVIDHIEGSVYLHPRTGLFMLKLIRADYDETTLRSLTPENSNLMNFQRKAWGETINEIVVTYKNPENEEEVSFAIQDNANIAMQGAVVTDNRNYYGIRSAALAARVAERDLRSASAPLCSCDVEVDRSAWDLVPGDVIKLTWPEYGLTNLVMRVGPVDYGKPGEPRIRASLIEDVFFMPDESYFIPPESEWVDPRQTAEPIPITKIISIPFYYLVQRFPVDEENAQQHPYPETIAGVLGSTYQQDAHDFDLATPLPDAVGNIEYRVVGTKQLVGYSLLDTATALEAKSYIKFHAETPKGGPTVGGFGIISDEDDFFAEVVAFESYDEDLGWLVWRGALDTVPRVWPAETPIRFIDNNSSFLDKIIRADMETVEYKLLTTTSLNTLEMSDAPEVTGLLNGRPHYPFRPANVRMNAMLWGASVVDGTEGINLTWALRSRLQETSVIMLWTEESVIPEDGQTTTVTFFDHEGEVIQKLTGLTGTTASLDFSLIPGPSVEYRVESERDGLASLQYVEHEFDVCGWGMNYGNYYGGKP